MSRLVRARIWTRERRLVPRARRGRPTAPVSAPPGYPDGYAGARVVVLGASGFIGRWVARGLVDRGAEVWLVIRDRQAAADVFSAYGVRGPLAVLDALDSKALASLYASIRPAITFNCVGYGVDRTERDAAMANQINAHLLARIVESLEPVRDLSWGGRDIVHVGSCAEYGERVEDPREDSDTVPTTLYGCSKLAGTRLLAELCQAREVRGVTARLFTVYGPGEHRGRLLPTLIEATRSGEPVHLTAGDQQRDFTYVEDVAEGLLRLGLSRGSPGGIVNLATGVPMSVRAFAETAAHLLDLPPARLRFGAIATSADEIHQGRASVERLKGLIGWVPSTTVPDGVRRTIQVIRGLNLTSTRP